ncbi:MAG: DUF4932 domain-containing protein [Treponema sp.]|nr:DUF4932 domain-containing protein [Treponema sp.]
MKNMVDEGYELAALIFRLTGTCWEFADLKTEYQRKLAETFAGFAEHPAVKMARSFDGSNGIAVRFDAVPKFSLHIEKRGDVFAFIDDKTSLFEEYRWNEAAARDFLALFNDFYKDVNFSDFYGAHVPHYEELTREFIEKSYNSIDFDWLGKYLDKSKLHCVITPSTRSNFCAKIHGKAVYCFVGAGGYGRSEIVVHEFCHGFTQPIADKWYAENEQFKKWCDETLEARKLPYYGTIESISGEYVNRAYTILHCCQAKTELKDDPVATKWSEIVPLLMACEMEEGFAHISGVYGMVLEADYDAKRSE